MEIPQTQSLESGYLNPTQDPLTSPACHSPRVNTEMPDLLRPIGLPESNIEATLYILPSTNRMIRITTTSPRPPLGP
jgi:hypothetical protein